MAVIRTCSDGRLRNIYRPWASVVTCIDRYETTTSGRGTPVPASRMTPLTDAVEDAVDGGGVCAIATPARINTSVDWCIRCSESSGFFRRRRGQVHFRGYRLTNLYFNHMRLVRKPVRLGRLCHRLGCNAITPWMQAAKRKSGFGIGNGDLNGGHIVSRFFFHEYNGETRRRLSTRIEVAAN